VSCSELLRPIRCSRPGRRKYVPVGSARDVLSRDGPAREHRIKRGRSSSISVRGKLSRLAATPRYRE
jgi:hypothetical protein